MDNTIYVLDFKHGTVEEIDESVPPRGSSEAPGEPEALPAGSGYVLATLGTPPAERG